MAPSARTTVGLLEFLVDMIFDLFSVLTGNRSVRCRLGNKKLGANPAPSVKIALRLCSYARIIGIRSEGMISADRQVSTPFVVSIIHCISRFVNIKFTKSAHF